MITQNLIDPEFEKELRRLHQEMLDENALYEELADSNELTERDFHYFEKYFEGENGNNE